MLLKCCSTSVISGHQKGPRYSPVGWGLEGKLSSLILPLFSLCPCTHLRTVLLWCLLGKMARITSHVLRMPCLVPGIGLSAKPGGCFISSSPRTIICQLPTLYLCPPLSSLTIYPSFCPVGFHLCWS